MKRHMDNAGDPAVKNLVFRAELYPYRISYSKRKMRITRLTKIIVEDLGKDLASALREFMRASSPTVLWNIHGTSVM